MLNCELCDYLKKTSGETVAKCEFTGHVFYGTEKFDMEEYPCKNLSYKEYLENRSKIAAESIKAGENKRVYRLTGDDWRYAYLRKHPAARIRRAA